MDDADQPESGCRVVRSLLVIVGSVGEQGRDLPYRDKARDDRQRAADDDRRWSSHERGEGSGVEFAELRAALGEGRVRRGDSTAIFVRCHKVSDGMSHGHAD